MLCALLMLFLLSQQPFQMVLVLITTILFLLPYLHSMNFFHWSGFMIIMIYLGGLLILFLYFTSIMTSYKMFMFFPIALLFIGLSGTTSSLNLMKEAGFSFPYSGLFAFSFAESNFLLLAIFLLLTCVLLLISFVSKLASPMRQN